ncbi:hypothetical protein FOWG_17829 [Fusarium oxysporum f. sp. lycopersici MN25]|nr:hypothetical protein FOWG_17829 [Fusarium oxysporum f. sp. lycopersici MN25]
MASNQKNTATGQNETADSVQFVTNTLGNTVGGVVGTLEIGQPVGNVVGGIGTGVESLLNNVAKGVEEAGKQK